MNSTRFGVKMGSCGLFDGNDVLWLAGGLHGGEEFANLAGRADANPGDAFLPKRCNGIVTILLWPAIRFWEICRGVGRRTFLAGRGFLRRHKPKPKKEKIKIA